MSHVMSYIAGVMDGEGCFMVQRYIRKRHSSLAYRAYMNVTNNHVPLLQFLQKEIGGRITRHSIRPGKYEKNKCYVLALSANEIRNVLPRIIPLLFVKKEQAEILLEFLSRQEQQGLRPPTSEMLVFYEDCYQRIRDLKKVSFDFKEETVSLGNRKCMTCNKEFEVCTGRNKRQLYCSKECKKKMHWTRSNRRIAQGIPAWNGLKTVETS